MSYVEDEYYYLSEEEFESYTTKQKWDYIQSLMKLIKDYKIQADKNCDECEHKLISPYDLNITMLFEDWRNCQDNCDYCGKEEQINMCHTQFEIINHITNEVLSIKAKMNALTKLYFKLAEKGPETIKALQNEINEQKKKLKSQDALFI